MRSALALGGCWLVPLLYCAAAPATVSAQQDPSGVSVFLPARPELRGIEAPVSSTPAFTSMQVGGDVAQSIDYSDAYYTRLTIHRIGSYAMLPLFAAQYLLGDRLMQDGDVSENVKTAHQVNAYAIGALFVTNTVTGVWNLAESRKDPDGRGRRLVHAALMIAADAGFAYTASLSDDAGADPDSHRNAALLSIGSSTAGALIMWIGNR
jgi:hypothetical protein